jgi:5'-nucleotidase/UDP-sugar diphosphatase
VSVGGRPLEDDRLYTQATNDFLAAGGNGYAMFSGREPVYNDSGRWIRDIAVEWWRARGSVTVATDGRIAPAP